VEIVSSDFYVVCAGGKIKSRSKQGLNRIAEYYQMIDACMMLTKIGDEIQEKTACESCNASVLLPNLDD
jgi:hypothetical protein